MWGISKSLRILNNPPAVIAKTKQEGPKKRFTQTVPENAQYNKKPKSFM